MKAALQGRTKSAKLLLFAGKYNRTFSVSCFDVNFKYFFIKFSFFFHPIDRSIGHANRSG